MPFKAVFYTNPAYWKIHLWRQDDDGNTILHWIASFQQNARWMNELIQRYPGDLPLNYRGRSPLYSAADSGNAPTVQVLLEHVDSSETSSALPDAIGNGNETITRMLLRHGAYVDSRDSTDRSPLYAAIESGVAGVVKALLRVRRRRLR